jgi:hypothetical protein
MVDEWSDRRRSRRRTVASWLTVLWVVALVAGLLLPRVALVRQAGSVLMESDEAIVGLMARHMLAGHFPIWFYGQAYLGSLEAATTAALFALFGASPLVLKLGAFSWFVAFLPAHYLLAREVGGTTLARLSTLLVAASPAFLTVWTIKAGGGYMALLCLGTIALLLTTRMLAEGLTVRRAAVLGLVLGLAWWTHLLALAYIAPILLLLIVEFRHQMFSRASAVFVAAGLIGSLPFWVYNILRAGATLRLNAPHPMPFWPSLAGFFRTAVPVFLGTRPEGGTVDFFRLGSAVGLLLFVIALVLPWFRRSRSDAPPARHGRLLLLVMFGFFPVLFAASGFGGVVSVPRYLIPLYSGIYVLLLVGFRPAAQLVLATLLLAVNLTGSFRTPAIDLATTLNAEPNTALIAFLHAHHVRTAYAPYWTAYRLTFETHEEIICTPPENGGLRYTPYLAVVQADRQPAFIRLDAPRYEGTQSPLVPPPDYVMTRIGNYEVFLPPGDRRPDPP